MASRTSTIKLMSLSLPLFAFVLTAAMAGDPDIFSDFILPSNLTAVDGNFFTFTAFRPLVRPGQISTFKVSKASITEFPALKGQSVSYAVLQFPSGSTNPLHTHPCSAELLVLLTGSLEVAFVDTTKKLYTQSLEEGDMFIFPKGLLHYQHYSDPQKPAVAISAFGSANAGTFSVPTGIDDNVLALSFKTEVATIKQLKSGLAPKP